MGIISIIIYLLIYLFIDLFVFLFNSYCVSTFVGNSNELHLHLMVRNNYLLLLFKQIDIVLYE